MGRRQNWQIELLVAEKKHYWSPSQNSAAASSTTTSGGIDVINAPDNVNTISIIIIILWKILDFCDNFHKTVAPSITIILVIISDLRILKSSQD